MIRGPLADELLAPLAADLYRHQRRELGMSAKRIKDTLNCLANAAAAPAAPAGAHVA